MSTASGSSGSPATFEATHSIVVDMLYHLDRMDDLLINSCREARTSLGNPDTFPVTNEDFQLLVNAKRKYQDANYSTDEVSSYLSRLTTYDGVWENVCRGILRHVQNDPSRVREWCLWLRQVERAGSMAWEKAFNFARFSNTDREDKLAAMKALMNALVQKFTVVDEGLDEIHQELYSQGREVRFSAELRDSIDAETTISEQGGVPTDETISNFKAAIRMQRAAAAARWTGTQQEPATGDSGQLRRRRIALDPQAVENNQDRGGDQAIPLERIEPEAPRRYDSTVLALVGLLSVAAGFVTGHAFSLEDQTIGSHNDADFWLLVQSSLLQLAGMIPVTVALWFTKSASLQPRFWSWFFLIIGVLCSFLSPVLYLTVPKQASGAVACAGGVSQAFIILEAMFLAQRAFRRDEAGERAR